MAAVTTVWYSRGLCYIVRNERTLSTTIREKNRRLASAILAIGGVFTMILIHGLVGYAQYRIWLQPIS